MYKEYILTTSIFSLVYLNDPYCDYFVFLIPGKQDHLTIDIHFQLNYLNGVHTKEVNLLKSKRSNELPPLYPVFLIPYQIELKASYTEHTTLVQLIYIDASPDPGFFAMCITKLHMTNFSHTYIVVTLKNITKYYWTHDKQEASVTY